MRRSGLCVRLDRRRLPPAQAPGQLGAGRRSSAQRSARLRQTCSSTRSCAPTARPGTSTWPSTSCARRSATSPRSRPIRSATSSRAGRETGPLLALFAHLDVIGLAVVAHRATTALIAVHKLGGSRANVAYGQRVEIRTKAGTVPGVVARKVKDDEKVEWEQLYVDIGARDGEEARALVAPGDPMVLVAAAARARRRPGRLAQPRQPRRRLRRARGAAAARAARTSPSSRRRRRSSAHHGARAAAHAAPAGRRDRDRRHLRDRRAGRRQRATGGHHGLGGGPAIFRGPRVNPRVLRAPRWTAAARRGSTHTVEAGAKTVHGRRRHLRRPRGDPDRARLDPAPQHALADRDRPARRPRGVHPAARRVRPASSSPAPSYAR